jgi:2,4-dienoyl-CoA reductase-like NADH-dependent reductase (Old Yellow Enzyme family)
MTTEGTTTTVLAAPLTLPCGLVLPNRMVKAAMAEGLGNPWTADVTPALIRLYERWADGGTGTLITGVLSVQRGAEDNFMVALDDTTDTDALRRWAQAVHRRDVRLFGQVQHPGRAVQVHMTRHPLAPSELPPMNGSRLYGSSRAMSAGEIADMVERFAEAAVLLEQAAFDGVELHAAHGYLLGQFLSPETNLRTDEWGGDLERRARFLIEIVRAVRSRVDPSFAVAVKINSSDFRPGGFDIDDSAYVVGMLGAEGVDLIEISGGTYESASWYLGVDPDDPGTSKDAYFAALAPRLREMTDVPLALTGGLRSRTVMEQLIQGGTVDLIGLGRPLIQQPDFTARLLDGSIDSIDLTPCPAEGFDQVLWWLHQFKRLSSGQDFDPSYTPRQSQLETGLGVLRQVAARARSGVLTALPRRR